MQQSMRLVYTHQRENADDQKFMTLSSTTSPSIADQVIIITGASAGIGAAIAQQLATHYRGVSLVLAARSAERLAHVADGCRAAGATVRVVPTDMANIEQVRALAQTTLDEFGRVDMVINNAGYGQMSPVELLPIEACQRQFQVNFFGVLALLQAVIPVMRSQGGGRIINISSLAGRIPFPFAGLYSASKFALESLSDTLRMELEPFNIRVSVVEPGPVKTEFLDVARQQIQQVVPNPEQSPYRAAFAQVNQLEAQTERQSWTSEQVADVVLRAIRDRHPKPRYVAATGGRILLFVMRKLLPTRWVDRFWQRFYGIDKVAQDWRQQMQLR